MIDELELLKPLNRKNWDSATLNLRTYTMYYNLLCDMAIAIYRWENLPKSINVRWMESQLIFNGLAAFFFDSDYDVFFALKATPGGRLNMMNEPIQYTAYGASGYSRRMTAYNNFIINRNRENCVPIWDNYSRLPKTNGLMLYARKLADIDRTIDINLVSQKTPVILLTDAAQKLAAENILKQWAGNEPAIVMQRDFMDNNNIDYLSSGAPYIVDKLLIAKSIVWNEAMTYLGVNNANIGKRERLITDEVNANNGQVAANRLIGLNCRRTACEQINELFDLNVQVYYNSDLETRLFDGVGLAPLSDINVDVED
jgi:hypothetical protein